MRNEDKSAKAVLISYLARRDYAEAELRFRLLRKGYTEEATADALAFAKERGYIDDRRFASQFISAGMDHKSRRRLHYELSERGLGDDVIRCALADYTEEDEKRSAVNAARKWAQGRDLTDPVNRDKCRAYLIRNGFPYGCACSAIADFHDFEQ